LPVRFSVQIVYRIVSYFSDVGIEATRANPSRSRLRLPGYQYVELVAVRWLLRRSQDEADTGCMRGFTSYGTIQRLHASWRPDVCYHWSQDETSSTIFDSVL